MVRENATEAEVVKEDAEEVEMVKEVANCPFCSRTFAHTKDYMQYVLFGTHHFPCHECAEDYQF